MFPPLGFLEGGCSVVCVSTAGLTGDFVFFGGWGDDDGFAGELDDDLSFLSLDISCFLCVYVRFGDTAGVFCLGLSGA